MAALQRLQWIEMEVAKGRGCHVSVSFNAAKATNKVKFVLEQEFRSRQSQGVNCAIVMVRDLIMNSIVVDKGHCSKSSGRSIVEFYLKEHVAMPNLDVVSIDATDLPPVPPPPLDSNLDRIAEKLQHVEQLCLHANTNMHLLYPIQSAAMAINHKLDQLTAVNNQLVDAVDLSRADLRVMNAAYEILKDSVQDSIAKLDLTGVLWQQFAQTHAAIHQSKSDIIQELQKTMLHSDIDANTSHVPEQLSVETQTLPYLEKSGGNNVGVQANVGRDADVALQVDACVGSADMLQIYTTLDERQSSRDPLFRRKVNDRTGLQENRFGRVIMIKTGALTGTCLYTIRFDDGQLFQYGKKAVEDILL